MPYTNAEPKTAKLRSAVSGYTSYASDHQFSDLRGKVVLLVTTAMDAMKENPRFLKDAALDISSSGTQGLLFLTGQNRDVFILSDGTLLERRHHFSGDDTDIPMTISRLTHLYSVEDILSGLESAVADHVSTVGQLAARNAEFVAQSKSLFGDGGTISCRK